MKKYFYTLLLAFATLFAKAQSDPAPSNPESQSLLGFRQIVGLDTQHYAFQKDGWLLFAGRNWVNKYFLLKSDSTNYTTYYQFTHYNPLGAKAYTDSLANALKTQNQNVTSQWIFGNGFNFSGTVQTNDEIGQLQFNNGNAYIPSIRIRNSTNTLATAILTGTITLYNSSIYTNAATGYNFNSVTLTYSNDGGGTTGEQEIHWTSSLPTLGVKTDIYFPNANGTVALRGDSLSKFTNDAGFSTNSATTAETSRAIAAEALKLDTLSAKGRYQSNITNVYQQTIYNSTNLSSDFTAVGFTPTISTNNGITFTGGSTAGTQYLQFNNLTNNDENTDFEVEYTATDVTGGILRIGKKTINTYYPTFNTITGKFDLPTNTWAVNGGMTGNSLALNPGGIIVAAGDKLRLKVSQRSYLFVYTFTDITQGVSISTAPVQASLNAGNWVITNDGGNGIITAIKITSYTPKNMRIAVLSDSKGLINLTQRWPNMIKILGTVNVFAGSSDGTNEMLACMPYITKFFHPEFLLFNGGRNDLAFGVPFSTTTANYTSIVNTATVAGIKVIHMLPIPESNLDQSTLTNWITSNYTATISNADLDTTKDLNTDKIHPNVDGCRLLANNVVNSGLISKSTTSAVESNQQLRDITSLATLFGQDNFILYANQRVRINSSATTPFVIDDMPASVASALTGTADFIDEKSSALNSRQISANNSSTGITDIIGRARGTLQTPAALINGDVIKQFNFAGYDGGALQNTAYLRLAVDGTPASGVMPERFEFGVGALGSVSAQTKLTLFSDGHLQLGGTSLATTATLKGLNLIQGLTPIQNNSTLVGAYFGDTFNAGTGALTATASGTTTAGDGTITTQPAITVTGSGSGAAFTVTTVSNTATTITQTTGGIGYNVGDTFTITALPGITFTVTSLGYSGTLQLAAQFTAPLFLNSVTTPATLSAGMMWYTSPDLFFRGTSTYNVTHPALTNITTAISGLIKGNGSTLLAAVSGTDYTSPTGTENISNKTFTDKLRISTSANAGAGSATLSAGTVTVSNSIVTASSIIILSRKTSGGTAGTLNYTISAGSGFTITSSSGSDTGSISYLIIN